MTKLMRPRRETNDQLAFPPAQVPPNASATHATQLLKVTSNSYSFFACSLSRFSLTVKSQCGDFTRVVWCPVDADRSDKRACNESPRYRRQVLLRLVLFCFVLFHLAFGVAIITVVTTTTTTSRSAEVVSVSSSGGRVY